jgi:GH35 family endo-1,4-beta-xylanase
MSEPLVAMRKAAELVSLPVGCVMNYVFFENPGKVSKTVDDLDDYLALATTQYNFLTEENGCKWRYSDQHDRGRCVYMLELAEAHNMSFRNHALVWGKEESNPDYFDEGCVYDDDGNLPGRCKEEVGTYTVGEKYAILDEHVKNETEFYRGRVAAWDVVNEAVCDCWLSYANCELFVAKRPDLCGLSELYSSNAIKVYLKRNIYWPDLPDYIGRTFVEAKKYDAEALLGYNDYKHEAEEGWQRGKGDMVYQLIKSMVEQGVPIDYVGSQSHIDLGYLEYSTVPDWETNSTYLEAVAGNMRRYAEIGVEWHFTEITIGMESVVDVWDESKEVAQAYLYEGLLDLCLKEDMCTCFQTWGFVDSWTVAYSGLHPYPFAEDYSGKAAHTGMLEVLRRHYNESLQEEERFTVSPSKSPTPVPSELPTAVPSESPTPVPPGLPTAVPSESLTPVPSELPTAVPSSNSPTKSPSKSPTAPPTTTPTPTMVTPTSSPTVVAPTVSPTIPASADVATHEIMGALRYGGITGNGFPDSSLGELGLRAKNDLADNAVVDVTGVVILNVVQNMLGSQRRGKRKLTLNGHLVWEVVVDFKIMEFSSQAAARVAGRLANANSSSMVSTQNFALEMGIDVVDLNITIIAVNDTDQGDPGGSVNFLVVAVALGGVVFVAGGILVYWHRPRGAHIQHYSSFDGKRRRSSVEFENPARDNHSGSTIV